MGDQKAIHGLGLFIEHVLNDIKDVEIGSPANDEVLTYENGKWKNKAPTGGGVSFRGFKAYVTGFHFLTAGAWTTIPLNTEVWDDDGDFDSSTYIWTVPVTARYFLAFQVASSFQDGEAIQGVIRKTVSPFTDLLRCYNSAGGLGSISAASSTLCSLTANDTYHVRAYISAGGNRMILAGYSQTFFVVGKL